MNNNKPTKKQTELLEFIEAFTVEHGYSPSYREIQAGFNLRSVSAVSEHIENLALKGLIRKVSGTARSLEVVKRREVSIEELISDLEGIRGSGDSRLSAQDVLVLEKTVAVLGKLVDSND
jgi:SOS-response transcriptional repressor LexA